MNPPLLEVTLLLKYAVVALQPERFRYFSKINPNLIPVSRNGDGGDGFSFSSSDRTTTLSVGRSGLTLRSASGHSYRRLSPAWKPILDSLTDILEIRSIGECSLSYLNEIPLQELRSFRDYLNIGFDMPRSLKERFELFRSEFTFRSDFGEIRVWIQPEWNDRTEGYCVQLIFEARCSAPQSGLHHTLEQLHEGIKEVFHQIVSQDYISRLPQ